MTVVIDQAVHVHPDLIRRDFCAALSAMYRKEVPLYGDLIALVNDVNHHARQQGGTWEVQGECPY